MVEKIVLGIKVVYVLGVLLAIVMMVRSANRNNKNPWLRGGATAVIAIAIGYAMSAKPSSTRFIKAMGGQGDLTDAHLIIKWPQNSYVKEQRPIILRIPRGYLSVHPIMIDEKGKGVKRVTVLYDMPSMIPLAEYRVRETKQQGTPEWAEYKKNWIGNFQAYISRDSMRGYDTRMFVRKRAMEKTTSMRDTDIAGFERYSPKVCYTEEQLKNPDFQNYLQGKPADDPSPPNCRLDRSWSELVSPPNVTADEKGASIRCMSTSCSIHFSVSGRAVEISVGHKDIPRWKEYVEPTRKLIKSFTVEPTHPDVVSSAALQTK